MKLILSASFVFIFGITSFGQRALPCTGLEKIPNTSSIVTNGKVLKGFISQADCSSQNIFVVLSDTSYKVVGFVVSRDCDDCSLVDIFEKTFFGNKIPAGDWIFRNLRVGFKIYFDCITIEKNKKRYFASPILLEVN